MGKQTLNGSLLAVLCTGLTIVGMIGVFPYFEGYSTHRYSIGYAFLKSWNDYGGEWKHCLFVPLLVAGMIYLRWPELRKIPIQGVTGWGLGVLLWACFVYWLGYAAGNNYIGYASTHFLYAGLILWFLGWGWLRAVIFPSLFLLFMWPMGFLDNLLAFPLRLLMSGATHHLLNLFGWSNEQIGTSIVSAADPLLGLKEGARFALDVADPCSGIRSLFAMLMISSLYGYITFGGGLGMESEGRRVRGGAWKMGALFLSSFPLVIVGNVARIVLLVVGANLFGAPFAIGTPESPSAFHEGAGCLVYVVELMGLWGLGELLRRVGP